MKTKAETPPVVVSVTEDSSTVPHQSPPSDTINRWGDAGTSDQRVKKKTSTRPMKCLDLRYRGFNFIEEQIVVGLKDQIQRHTHLLLHEFTM